MLRSRMPNEHPVKLLAANIFDFIASLTGQSIHHACEYSYTCNWVTDGSYSFIVGMSTVLVIWSFSIYNGNGNKNGKQKVNLCCF